MAVTWQRKQGLEPLAPSAPTEGHGGRQVREPRTEPLQGGRRGAGGLGVGGAGLRVAGGEHLPGPAGRRWAGNADVAGGGRQGPSCAPSLVCGRRPKPL